MATAGGTADRATLDRLVSLYAAQSARVDHLNFIVDSFDDIALKVYHERKDNLFEIKGRDDSSKRKEAVLEVTANRAQRNVHALAQVLFDSLRNTTLLNNRLHFV
jgi:hypothetical protein